jgi:acyl-coenzyme A thioesterase PaaI-like protein
MATFSKQVLSGSTDGRGILVAATATAGTTIHTGSSTATVIDEVWLYAVNTSASNVKLTIEYGGTTSPNDLIEFTVPAEAGLYLIVPALLIKGNATLLVVRAFAATTNVIAIHGYVNRIS